MKMNQIQMGKMFLFFQRQSSNSMQFVSKLHPAAAAIYICQSKRGWAVKERGETFKWEVLPFQRFWLLSVYKMNFLKRYATTKTGILLILEFMSVEILLKQICFLKQNSTFYCPFLKCFAPKCLNKFSYK